MGKRVSIIGGSGFVGHAIVDQAVAAGHQVTVACRHPERHRDLLVKGASLVRADVTDGRGIEEAVAGQDVVIYLVGLLFERGRQTFAAAHVDGVARVLAVCERAGVKQYLHMSALGAGRVPDSVYAETKASAEALVAASGLNATIFRPSIIYGRGDSFFSQFEQMSAMLPVMPVISGQSRFQPVWVEDVARAFVQAIDNRHVNGETFELGGPKIYTFRQLLELLMQTLGRKRVFIPVPDIAAKGLALASSLMPTPLITFDQLELLAHNNVVNGEPFPAIFGRTAALEQVLPGYIGPDQAAQLQHRFDDARQHYRKGGI